MTSSDHTTIEPLTRTAVLKGLVQALTVLARGRLTSTEIADAMDSVMPSFETIAAAHALTLAAEDTSIIRPRLVTAMREQCASEVFRMESVVLPGDGNA